MIDVNPNQLKTVTRILAGHVPECEVRAFGSRVAWTAKDYSDLDLVVVGERALDLDALPRLKEAFEESDLPFRVDVLDWNAIGPAFQKVIEKKYEVVQKSKKRRSGIENEWIQTTLGAIAPKDGFGLVDGPFGSNLPASCYTETGIPVIRGSNLTLGTSRFLTDEFVFVSRDTAERLSRSLCRPLDIVFTKKGTLGQTGLVPEGGPYDLYLLSSNQMKLTVDSHLADPLFVYYFVSSTECTQKIIRDSEATGVPKTNVTYLRDFPIALPPLIEQRAIAHILGTLDDKIELNRWMNETLEAMARALFKSWFVDFDPVRTKAEGRTPGLPKPLADLFPDSFVDSELGEIPKGWQIGTLGMLGELAIGGDWGEDEAFAGAVEASCLRGVDLEHLRRSGHASAPHRWFKHSSLERRAMNDRDVLIAGSGAGPTGRPLWMCADLLQSLGPCVYSNFCKRIRCGTAAKAVYLDAWLHSIRESGEIWEHVNGTSVPNLDANSLLSGREIPLPPELVLDRYYDFVRPIWQKLYAGQNHTLAALRATLLPELISGDLQARKFKKSGMTT